MLQSIYGREYDKKGANFFFINLLVLLALNEAHSCGYSYLSTLYTYNNLQFLDTVSLCKI